MTMLAFVSPRRCAKCLTFMDRDRYLDMDECHPACLEADVRSFMDPPGKFGHLHWRCPDCGWMEATMPADRSGNDRWRQ